MHGPVHPGRHPGRPHRRGRPDDTPPDLFAPVPPECLEEGETAHPPMRLALRLSYLGDRFFGSQQQAEERTIEGEVITACRRLDLFSDWREARFAFAGRTDRGVHARGQVCAFDTQVPDRAREALSLQLPRDIWCTG